MGKKQPKWAKAPTPTKQPKWAREPQIDGQALAWRFSACDKTGPFSWAVLTDAKFKQVHDKLHEFETKTWDQLHAARCHPIECHRFEKPARDQLAKINLDDVDELMSFHIAGHNRVWCIQDRNIMRILWWDPDHQVYKTEKDRGDRRKRHRRGG